eukprot:15265607-Ditylum_brightwellii.AAC.1
MQPIFRTQQGAVHDPPLKTSLFCEEVTIQKVKDLTAWGAPNLPSGQRVVVSLSLPLPPPPPICPAVISSATITPSSTTNATQMLQCSNCQEAKQARQEQMEKLAL